jgi:preprotein translocase subunit SecF
MVEFDVPEVDYTRYSDRQLAAIPLAVLVLALVIIAGWYVFTGFPVDPGMEFTGGTELRISVEGDNPQEQINDAFSVAPASVQSVPAGSGGGTSTTYVVSFRDIDVSPTQLEDEARAAGFEVLSADTVSASFGSDTQTLAIGGIAVAFLGMSVLVFLMFRTFIPSVAVVLSAFSDIVVPVALMNLLGIELTLGTVAALLMLIGYSVDSDILLNNHILRRSGEFYESTQEAMRTGVTMTLTSMSAMAVMALAATLVGIDLLAAIGTILVLGLATDLMNTYMLNLSLLRWYKFEGVSK